MPLLLVWLILLGFPFAEFAFSGAVVTRFGPGVLLWFFVSFLVGMSLLRLAGFSFVLRLMSALQKGESPRAVMSDTARIVIAAVLLIVPGFLSDAIALLLLLVSLPQLATLVAHRNDPPPSYEAPAASQAGGDIIEGEFSVEKSERQRLPQENIPAQNQK